MLFPKVFDIQSEEQFEAQALEVFMYQHTYNPVYRNFCDYLKIGIEDVRCSEDIPFLPIAFFKQHQIITEGAKEEIIFKSSGTTGSATSRHYVRDVEVYQKSFLKTFELFYGNIRNYCVLALLPSYLERSGSSLVYMVDRLIRESGHPESGFYLNEHRLLREKLISMDASGTKILLLGVSFALMDLVEARRLHLNNTIVMETGGMKGRRKELIREQLHQILCSGFGVDRIHSEYGMTELLSQAYSKGNGRFSCPPWMKVVIRDTEDPLSLEIIGKTGGLNIIDLANMYSCPFIASDDLGRIDTEGNFEVLGRFDHSDIRGCNLMVL